MVLGLVEHAWAERSERHGGRLNEASLEMLTLGRGLAKELDASLEAILIGEAARPLAENLPAYGVTRVHLVRHAWTERSERHGLDEYAPEAWARSIVQLIESVKPQVVMAAGTDRGHEVLAHVAAITDLPMAANCIEVHPYGVGVGLAPTQGARKGHPYRITRVRWGGSLLEEAYLDGEPKLLTIAPYVVAAEKAPVAGELILNEFTPSLQDKDFRVRVTEQVESSGDRISLADARVVVGGGRGVGSAEGFKTLEELADLLGGAVGASRAVTNLGWRPHADQIGQTGARIAPDLYIACGISGAIQHMVGCKGAKRILAINTDPEAPIVARADYAVIGDLHQVVPALIAEIKTARGNIAG